MRLEALTATQRDAVTIAANEKDDVKAAEQAGRSVGDFAGIIEDACMELGITGSSYIERRQQICALALPETGSAGAAAALNGAHHPPGETTPSHEGQGSPERETRKEKSMQHTAESMQKKLKKLPAGLQSVAKAMAQGNDIKGVAKVADLKESTAKQYMSKVTTHFSLGWMKPDEKAELLKLAFASTKKGSPGNGHAAAERPQQPVRQQRQSTAVQKLSGADGDAERLRDFAHALGGGELADTIGRILERLDKAKALRAALQKVDF